MRRNEIVKQVVLQTGIETADVSLVLEAVLKTIKKEVSKGNRVDFRGFGSFMPKRYGPKQGYDFRTGAHIPVAPVSKPVFKPSRQYFRIEPRKEASNV